MRRNPAGDAVSERTQTPRPILACTRCDGTTHHNGGSCEACDGSGNQLCEYCSKEPARHTFTHTTTRGDRWTDLICEACWEEMVEDMA